MKFGKIAGRIFPKRELCLGVGLGQKMSAMASSQVVSTLHLTTPSF